jgi:colanic acid biosynthesis glycosyl transferase WcaI
VGINYAPEPSGSAPYTAGLAEMLAEADYCVDVVAGVPHYPTWRIAPGYRWALRRHESRNGVRVHRMRHFVPRSQSAFSRMAWDGTFLGNALAYSPPRPDAIIASMPSLGGGVYAACIGRRYGVPFGVLVQDLVGQAVAQSGLKGGGRAAGATAAVERQVLLRADLVAVVSDAFRGQIEEYGVDAARVITLPNWTHIDPSLCSRKDMRRRLKWGGNQFVVLHSGNMGLKQDLGNVVEAARLRAPADDVLFVLLGDGNQRRALERQAAGLPNVRFLDSVPGGEYPDVLAAADLLLVNERPTVGDMSLPSKLTSYLAAGRPVLAAVGEAGACGRELRRTNGAADIVPPGEPQTLADAVLRLRSTPERLADMGQRASAYADRRLGRSIARRRVLDFAAALIDGTDHGSDRVDLQKRNGARACNGFSA